MRVVHRLLSTILLLGLLLLGCRDDGPVPEHNVVILVIDGPRWAETFGDTAHTHIPYLWNELCAQGTLFTNFRNEGETLTVPGHVGMITGTRQVLRNDGSERPHKPTLFEYYRSATGAEKTDAWVVSGKRKLYVCSHSDDTDYGPEFVASENAVDTGDATVHRELLGVLATYHPRLVLACFPEVDVVGHWGVRQDYLAAIERVDSLVAATWNWLQSDTLYAGRTFMFISADHGRHDDRHGGFRHHGCSCEGCRHIFLLALGPGIKKGHAVATRHDQRDVCATAAHVLGIPAPKSDGVVLMEMFDEAEMFERDAVGAPGEKRRSRGDSGGPL